MYKILEKLTLWKIKSDFYSTEEERAYMEVRDWICDTIEEKQNSKLIVCKASTNGKTKSGLTQELKYKTHDEVDKKQRKPKFTPIKQNPNYKCVNCKHYHLNQENKQKWSCVLKKVVGIFSCGYCEEFAPSTVGDK